MFNEPVKPVCHQSCSVYWYIFTHHLQGTMFEALSARGPPEEFGSPRNWCTHIVQVVCHRMPGEPSGNVMILQPKPPLIHPNASLWVCNSSGGRLLKLLHNITLLDVGNAVKVELSASDFCCWHQLAIAGRLCILTLWSSWQTVLLQFLKCVFNAAAGIQRPIASTVILVGCGLSFSVLCRHYPAYHGLWCTTKTCPGHGPARLPPTHCPLLTSDMSHYVAFSFIVQPL